MAVNPKLVELMSEINLSGRCAGRGITALMAGDAVALLKDGDAVGHWHSRFAYFEYLSESLEPLVCQRAYWLEKAVAVASGIGVDSSIQDDTDTSVAVRSPASRRGLLRRQDNQSPPQAAK